MEPRRQNHRERESWNPGWLPDPLEDVGRGQMTVEEALARLMGYPYEDLGFVRLDSHRTLREGFPEIAFCPGKMVEQIVRLMARIRVGEGRVLAARAAARLQIGECGQGGGGASEPGVGGVRS